MRSESGARIPIADTRVSGRQEYRAVGGAVLVSATLTAHSSSSVLTGSVAWVYWR
jgi:hypothetical protein